jgi:hypothetical protein
MTLYVNGVPQAAPGTVNFGGKKLSPATPSDGGVIGAEEDGASHYFFGRIADLRLYNRALSREEMADIAAPPR